MNSCIGLTWLGMCAYNPALPAPTYFTLGNAIAALAFTLAVQTFLKPVYRLRLGVRYLSLGRLYILIFVAVGVTVIAALVPSFPILHSSIWGYPIFYELLATVLFSVAYGAVAIAVVRPVKVTEKRVEYFARVTARMLSSATEADHIDLLPDLQLSLPCLIKLAAFVEDRGDEVSAFYLFIHRRRIAQASYAYSILRILSDPLFCRSLITRAPWAVANIVSEIGEKKLHARAAERFIQELAHQAILADDGMMARELDYHGFGAAPVLSDALFSNIFIVDTYDPLQTYLRPESITTAILKRFNAAVERCYLTLIEHEQFYRAQVTFSIECFYEATGMRAWALQESGDADFGFDREFERAVRNATAIANKLMAAASPNSYEHMFVENPKDYRQDPLEPLVEIVFNALSNISNLFKGYPDRFWHLAIDVVLHSYRSIGSEPDGMTPFQQRLTLKLIDKLSGNMNGYYPAICRVLLATVGPYQQNALQPNMTVFNILRNSMYAELKKFPELAKEKPNKVTDYLPENITYDVATATLTHTYSGGAQMITELRALEVVNINLLDPKYRRQLSEEERKEAERDL